jgi:putative exporter of polyketide antibiotics
MRLAVLTRSDRAQLVIWIAGSVIAVLLASNISAAAAARRKHAARGSAR